MSYQHQYVDGTRIHFPLGKVVCVGRNYAEHARELNNPIPEEPLLFIKPASAAVELEGGFAIPEGRGEVHYEAEIAVLIGKPLSRQPGDEEIRDAISGFGVALDLTLREVQARLKAKGHPWEIAKAFDGACPLSPFVPGDAVEDLGDIGVRLSIDGELRQDGNSRDMLTPILDLLRYISGHFSLQPGDVVLTGTPAGVGTLQRGNRLLLELGDLCRVESRVL